MHSYLISLRITGEDLDHKRVSADLGIEPTQIRIRGQPRPGSKSVWRDTMWEYEVRPSSGKDWDSLEQGLKKIALRFQPQKEILRRYQQQFKVELFCGHFSSGFNGGPTLSPEILKQLGEFGVEVSLDTYSSADSSDE